MFCLLDVDFLAYTVRITLLGEWDSGQSTKFHQNNWRFQEHFLNLAAVPVTPLTGDSFLVKPMKPAKLELRVGPGAARGGGPQLGPTVAGGELCWRGSQADGRCSLNAAFASTVKKFYKALGRKQQQWRHIFSCVISFQSASAQLCEEWR